jgi:hypothetical protein
MQATTELSSGLTCKQIWHQEDPALRAEINSFLIRERAFGDPEKARRYANNALGILQDADGRVVGVSSISKMYVSQVRLYMWNYQMFISKAYRRHGHGIPLFEQDQAYLNDLAIRQGGRVDDCVGILAAYQDKVSHPELERLAVLMPWGMQYSGRDLQGYPVRLYYFPGADINGPSPDPAQAARVQELPPSDLQFEWVWSQNNPVVQEEVMAFWAQHRALPDGIDLQQRAKQVCMCMRDPQGKLIGVASTGQIRLQQLQMTLLNYRTFVAPEWRRHHGAMEMMLRVLDRFDEISENGLVDGCSGVMVALQNTGVQSTRTACYWPSSRMVLVSQTQQGVPVRVRYFPGAEIPDKRPVPQE